MDLVKWGFIGCGDMTEKKSGPVFSLVENSEVTAVMNDNRKLAEEYSVRHNIKRYYDDALQLISDADVNAVYIATPPSTHATYAIMAMKEGKPVYIEKPMAASYEDCCRINRVSEETGVPCFVAYYRRYLPYFRKVKELVESNAIGRILDARIEFSQPASELDCSTKDRPWRIDCKDAEEGYFFDIVPHQIDIIQDICGCILDAYGCLSNIRHTHDAEDMISCCFSFENGAVGTGSWSFGVDDSTKEDKIEILGDNGRIRFSAFTYSPITVTGREGTKEYIVENPQYVQYPLIENVIRHLQGKDVCECNGVNATLTSWVIDKIRGKI